MTRLLGIGVAALMTFVASGCSATSTTLARPDQPGQVLYRISEQQAFTTALEAYAALYPKQSVDDIVEGGRRGYNADEYRGLDSWSHRLLVIPAAGTDSAGNEVRGYWYSYSGKGTMAYTSERTTGLIELIRSKLDATGTAVTVSGVREGQYETDGKAYLGLKRDARDIPPGLPR